MKQVYSKPISKDQLALILLERNFLFELPVNVFKRIKSKKDREISKN
jgi:hypothetical protein